MRNQARFTRQQLEWGAFLAGHGDLIADLWIRLFDEARAGQSPTFYPRRSRAATAEEKSAFKPDGV